MPGQLKFTRSSNPRQQILITIQDVLALSKNVVPKPLTLTTLLIFNSLQVNSQKRRPTGRRGVASSRRTHT